LALHGPNETTDFLAMEQQHSGPIRLMIRVAAAFVRRDVKIEEKYLPISHIPVGVRDVGLPLAE
jgi:hypothetical protein